MRSPKHLLGSLLLFRLLFSPSEVKAQLIFEDGFESGNTLAWTSVGEAPLVPADSYRTSSLWLRDPHVFINIPVFGCTDFTDNDLPLGLGPSFNSQLATAITADGDSDGFLDLSLMLLGRPFSPTAVDVRMDTASGQCAAPSPPTTCARDAADIPQTHNYNSQASGLCLDVVPGTTSGYSPAVTAPAAACFVTDARSLGLATSGIGLPLLAVQAAATFQGNPATSMSPGLLRGFLTEAAANAILLPANIPIVGGQPFSILLPGGQGSCANHDGRDTFETQSGWWFYFNYEAVPTPWTGP